jgi:molecular chaperone GrpE
MYCMDQHVFYLASWSYRPSNTIIITWHQAWKFYVHVCLLKFSLLSSRSHQYANISSRLEAANKAGKKLATKDIANKLLAVLDNYDRAFQQVSPETDEEKETEVAFKNVYTMVITTLEEMGIKQVETVGIEFDYEFHQAVMQRPDEDYEEGMVCEELAKGWLTEDGELIRAAMVVVAA